jgi:predicted ATPase
MWEDAPWWSGCYERRQHFDEAERTCAALVAACRTYDYELVELPRAPIGERVRFVLGHL